MSSHVTAPEPDTSRAPARAPVSLPEIAEMHHLGRPIVMVTAYDFPTAQIAEEAGVDMVLVGDSAANCVLGYDSTAAVGFEEMVMLARAVRRGLKTPLMVVDMPFGSYESSNEEAVRMAQRFVKETGCDAVKLERGGTSAERAAAIVAAGIPVMAHIGLTPQTATALGGFKAQGKTAERAAELIRDAKALEEAGCFSIVIEAVPAAVADLIHNQISIPTIGIGAGSHTSGQVLVVHDLLGINQGHVAKFVKQFANLRPQMVAGVRSYAQEVRNGTFPAAEHVYSVEASELAELQARLDPGNGLNSQATWDWEPLG
jgi:3-methyl-2-oxobutanoate hydroxymethyltransferase